MPSSFFAELPHPVTPVDAQGVEEVSSNLSEALEFLGRDADGQVSLAFKHWRELFAERESRLYYVNSEIAYNSWHAPPCFKFQEWALDAQLYSIGLRLARDIYETLDAFLTRHPPEVVYKALDVLARLVCNIADCGNSVERYRSVKVDNPKLRAAVWDVPGATQILFMVGFKHQGQVVGVSADTPLGPLCAAAARLRRLADKKGHSGSATHVKADGEGEGGSGRPASQLYNTPGFHYQEQIWHCAVCDHPINDGSERLWTGRHDAPEGEFRYQCTTCQGAGATFNLCQGCWDTFQQQQQQQQGAAGSSGSGGGGGSDGGGSRGGSALLHDRSHAFQHVGPRMTRWNDYYHNRGEGEGGDPANPWGRPAGGGASSRRALQRLGERHGIREWL